LPVFKSFIPQRKLFFVFYICLVLISLFISSLCIKFYFINLYIFVMYLMQLFLILPFLSVFKALYLFQSSSTPRTWRFGLENGLLLSPTEKVLYIYIYIFVWIANNYGRHAFNIDCYKNLCYSFFFLIALFISVTCSFICLFDLCSCSAGFLANYPHFC
jgi:hypothetical protein